MAGGLDQDITLEGAGCDGDTDWEDWEGEAGDAGVGVLEVGVDGEGEGLGAGDGVGAAPPAHPTAKMATPTSITVTNFLTLFIFIFRPFSCDLIFKYCNLLTQIRQFANKISLKP